MGGVLVCTVAHHEQCRRARARAHTHTLGGRDGGHQLSDSSQGRSQTPPDGVIPLQTEDPSQVRAEEGERAESLQEHDPVRRTF